MLPHRPKRAARAWRVWVPLKPAPSPLGALQYKNAMTLTARMVAQSAPTRVLPGVRVAPSPTGVLPALKS
eukprot:2110238-Amphidinium_carterae.1